MTAGRWTPSIAILGRAKKTRVIFEFRRELRDEVVGHAMSVTS